MNYFFKFFGSLFRFFGRYKRFIPGSIAGLFVVFNFFSDLINFNSQVAFENLAKSILSAELVINENVNLAIVNSPQYGLYSFIEIIFSIFILYTLIRFLVKLQVKVGGAQAEWGAYLVSLLMVFVIEISTVRFLNGDFSFIPFYDGLFFLFVNSSPVLNNIFGSSNFLLLNNSSNITNSSFNVSKSALFVFFRNKKFKK